MEEKKYHNVSGVILAGGAGKRLNGIIKAKLIIRGKPVISLIIDTLNELFDEIIIVTNTPDEFSEFSKFKIVGDQFFNKGPLAGLHSSMKFSTHRELFVVAGDMPLLDKDIIIKQLEYFNDNNYPALIPRINQFIEPLHGIYQKSLLKNLEEYLEAPNDYSIMAFLKTINTGYLQYEDSEITRKAFMNINSPSDLVIVERLLDPII
jgi:molybdopterin-guanine dinucleotide biosynthesis protein A